MASVNCDSVFNRAFFYLPMTMTFKIQLEFGKLVYESVFLLKILSRYIYRVLYFFFIKPCLPDWQWTARQYLISITNNQIFVHQKLHLSIIFNVSDWRSNADARFRNVYSSILNFSATHVRMYSITVKNSCITIGCV